MASKQQQGFRMCVHPCPRYLTGGDTHILCVACLGEEQHGQCSRALAVSTPMCFPCGRSDSAWRSFTRTERSPGLWSRCCRGTAKAAVLGFAKGSVCGGRDGRCLFSAFTSNQIKSNHFYCHITTAQVPWWVKFLRACSRQCKKTKQQFTYGQYIFTDCTERQCAKYTYIYTVKKKLLFLQENAGSCGYQRIPVKNTAAQYITLLTQYVNWFTVN